jgi:hypothetical protein
VESRNVWASAFFTTGAVVIVAAIGIAASPKNEKWESPLVLTMLAAGALLLLLAATCIVSLWRSRPRLTFGVGRTENAIFPGTDLPPCHFLRMWIMNDGRETALSVWVLFLTTILDENGGWFGYHGRWPERGMASSPAETHLPPTIDIPADGRYHPLDVAFQMEGDSMVYAYNDRFHFQPLGHPLGDGTVRIVLSLNRTGTRAVFGELDIISDPTGKSPRLINHPRRWVWQIHRPYRAMSFDRN